MPVSSYKVIPTIFNKKKEPCCICFDKKEDCIRCENPKCSDGIICLGCLKNMSEEQRKICQICRQKTEIFKIKPIEIHSSNKKQTIVMINKKKRKKCKCNCGDLCCSFICAIITAIITYGLGILTMHMMSNCDLYTLARSSNPIMFMLIGAIVIVILGVCLCACYMKFKILTR